LVALEEPDVLAAYMVDPYSQLDERGRFRELLDRPRWHLRAACRGSALTFVPATRAGVPEPDVVELCRGCSVRSECVGFALASGEFGYWGSSELERRRARRRGWSTERLLADIALVEATQ
jgi:Transcription factor WhiB